MSRRRLIVIAVAALSLVGGLAAWGALAPGHGRPKPPPALLPVGTAPVARAAAACHDLESVMAQVTHNASKDRVFSFLDAGRLEIALAAESEPIWLSLQSGLDSIKRGFERNDEASSELGIAIARDQCRRASVYLPGSVTPEPMPTATTPAVTSAPSP
jgi:uncharacterized protein YbjT (DUF2867 family)